VAFRFSAIYGVSCGLKYLHSRQPSIVHGDVKGKNVMVELRGGTVRAKVLDFGLSRILSGKPKTMGGTLAWIAPEVYRTPLRHPETSSDVFSFGRLLYFALAAAMPFSHTPMREVRHMLKTALLPTLTLPGVHAIEERLTDLLDSCLKVNESQRPSMQTVQHVLVETAVEFGDLAQCIIVAIEGGSMEALPNPLSASAVRQLPGGPDRQHVAATVVGNANCNEQEQRQLQQQQKQQQEQQQCPTSGHEPLSPRLCERLIHQGLLPTSAAGMVTSMLMTLQRWNFPLPRIACCPLHASLQSLRRIVEALARVECQLDFAPLVLGQCLRCGVMFHPDLNGCDFCGIVSTSSLVPIQQEGEQEPLRTLASC